LRFLDGSEEKEFEEGLKAAEIVDRLMGGLEACRQYE